MNKIEELFSKRIEKRLKPFAGVLRSVLGSKPGFYFAGGGLLKDCHDIDLFPMSQGDFNGLEFPESYVCLGQTRNAQTIKQLSTGKIIQLCSYYHPSLKELVNSFDFSHIQIGAEMAFIGKGEDLSLVVEHLYYTDAFTDAHSLEQTWYVGSEYPMSSLIRLFKYKERGVLPSRLYIGQAVIILADIVKRGFRDYNDFKDQLDAVDLGLLNDTDIGEDQAEFKNSLSILYENLCKELK
jgi:hypothetical protein